MSIGLLYHNVKKGSKISGGDDGPGPEPILLNSKLWYFFLFPLIVFIMSFNIDVDVAINDYHHHLGEKGEGYSRQSCRSCLQWLQWFHNLHISWTENWQ